MCPEIIPDEAVYGDPHVGLDPVLLSPRLDGVSFTFEKYWQYKAWESCN